MIFKCWLFEVNKYGIPVKSQNIITIFVTETNKCFTADDPEGRADNALLYLHKVYDILETEDGSDLTMGCTSEYADAWEEKTVGMVVTVNQALAGALCEPDIALVVTYIPSFASLGSQVKYVDFFCRFLLLSNIMLCISTRLLS